MSSIVLPSRLALRVLDLSGRNVHDEFGKLVWIAGVLRHEPSLSRGKGGRKGTQPACQVKFKLRHYRLAGQCESEHGFPTIVTAARAGLHELDSRFAGFPLSRA